MTSELDAARGGLRLDEIHSFVVLCEELNFTKAAKRLALTPGGLSRRIARLERALGGILLHRTTRAVRLTPYGTTIAPAARRLIADVNTLPGFDLLPPTTSADGLEPLDGEGTHSSPTGTAQEPAWGTPELGGPGGQPAPGPRGIP